MKKWAIAFSLLITSASAVADTAVWQPGNGLEQIAMWPAAPPDAKPMPGPEIGRTEEAGHLPGKTMVSVSNVSRPTMTVYPPKGRNTGAAVVVFPGGGFEILAMDLEGTEVCDWLTATGVTCVVLKYRVPSAPYNWKCDCRPHNLEVSVQALDDAQRALRLVRFHAAEWNIDPHKVGVLGFSAGGYLVAEISTRFKLASYAAVDAADKESKRPDFALAIYPGHLTNGNGVLNRNTPVSSETPPTFLLQAEDDHVDGVDQALVYYTALKNADAPVEMHLYPTGGHAFGLRPTPNPITRWPALAETWMRNIGIIAAVAP